MKQFEFKTKEATNTTLNTEVANLVSELMNAATSFHKLHLKIGNFAAHKCLNDIYTSLPDSADSLAEEFQGASQELLNYSEVLPKILNTKENGLQYAKDLKTKVTNIQSKLPYSEIINTLDNTKSDLNSLLYKLKFLS